MAWQTQATSPSKTHLRILFVITLLVGLWFFFTIPAPGSSISNFTGSYYSGANSHGSLRTGSSTDGKGFLPALEAKEYCERRRWEPYPDRKTPRKVYDLMMINTEIEWLEIRLGQMDADVDYFIIVESNKTFTDKDKPCYVRDNWDKFEKYHHKMIRHTLEIPEGGGNAWDREKLSRNAMFDQVLTRLEGEQKANKGDVVLVSDVDELPRPDTIKALRNCKFPKKVALGSKMYYYSFQWLARNEWWHPQATYFDGKDTILPEALRHSDADEDTFKLYNAAWHCSFCFPTVGELVTKIKSFSHTEMDREEITNKDNIVHRVRFGLDVFNRPESHFDRLDDVDHPEFLLNNKERYGYMLNRDGADGGFWDYPEEHGKPAN
ncbi:hypothetical protein HYFRA_00008467 [Hymenoscyphus fraxineus]|uniref:Glycosyltransferase family 17 protein n=1 Tax=Hymenoscyphus fraxineus TaxID=746836 RepID=A0A9N9KMW0_9HELO|nr:hypothetical protein HYFRA_00008467 [Hymenoscyphus fraxineus]